MGHLKHILISALLWSSIQTPVRAQQVYRSIEGTMVIMMTYHDTTLLSESHYLVTTLNYETCEFRFRVPYRSFRTGIGSIDSIFIKMNNRWLEFTGTLGIPYINTKNHPAQEFDVEGLVLTSIPPANVKATGSLTFIPGGTYSSMLTMRMPFSLSALNIGEALPNVSDRIEIYIQQAVLKRVDE